MNCIFGPGIFKKRGSETGGRLELKSYQEWIINAQFKQQYTSTEINTYPDEIAEVGRPVTTLRSNIKREWSKKTQAAISNSEQI